ncbi:amidase family protein [Tropicibacter sp. R16_0]|uniref:amidase family protein n=1 Tax=Tropicibacter sp. R16_0 TaxID=2821102 RepID=UPI001ADB5751|nr:amidase family protein [Tropicibacter sp. R16_0]MBO9451419.1 amidase family protein [Tropicibacter sp. R16_0]
MTDTDTWRLSASETVARTTSGDLTAEAAVDAALTRMDAVNPDLNAVVVSCADDARARALDLDKARASGAPTGPLHGVPVTIKINVDQTGYASSNGVPALKDLIAPDDAPLVRHLQDAGAVVIGRTNTPEFSFRADTDNPLHGRTHNPWGKHVSPGGSSGGAGSAIMAGIGALAHGNDIGGSLRFPAAANGAVTVKPGLGRVPAWNPSQTAERGMLAQSMSVQGLICRTAHDLHLAMPTMIRPDARDPFHAPLPWRGEALDGPIKVGFTKETYEFDLDPEVSRALDMARDALTDAGYEVVEVEPPHLRECGMDGYRTLMGEVLALMGPDIEKYGSPTIRAVFDEYFEQFPPYEGTDILRMMAKRSFYAREWSMFLDSYPLVLCPFLPQPFFAPDRDTQGADGVQEVLGSALWSYSMNFMGLPAACVPTHVAELPQGPQPMSVQIVARRWREDLAVDASAAIEARLGRMCDLLWQRMG